MNWLEKMRAIQFRCRSDIAWQYTARDQFRSLAPPTCLAGQV